MRVSSSATEWVSMHSPSSHHHLCDSLFFVRARAANTPGHHPEATHSLFAKHPHLLRVAIDSDWHGGEVHLISKKDLRALVYQPDVTGKRTRAQPAIHRRTESETSQVPNTTGDGLCTDEIPCTRRHTKSSSPSKPEAAKRSPLGQTLSLRLGHTTWTKPILQTPCDESHGRGAPTSPPHALAGPPRACLGGPGEAHLQN